MAELMVTKDLLLKGLTETELMIDTVCKEKYYQPGEHSLIDVMHRIMRVVREKTDRKTIDDSILGQMEAMLCEGYFVPGGSILAGIGQVDNKASLSNCYVVGINHDSIEAIGAAVTKCMRTYSYRGGCGTDISVLRPHGFKVHNAAKTSTGAVSFMPMFSQVTQTIGQEGRRGALMITISDWHPDMMRFLWCKADPIRVFGVDPAGNAAPSITGANISIKFSNEFLDRAYRNDPEPWVCKFPDIEHDKQFYGTYWSGDLEDWVERGGKVLEFTEYVAYVTEANKAQFIGHTVLSDDGEWHTVGDAFTLTPGREYRVKFGTPSQILDDFAMANWLRADPGIMYIDNIQHDSFTPGLHPELKVISSNPCSEIPLNDDGNCLLGAHNLSKYDFSSEEDLQLWYKHCALATIFMNLISDINAEMHYFPSQRAQDRKSKRIGIEIFGLADAFINAFVAYGSTESILLADKIFSTKHLIEFYTSAILAVTGVNGIKASEYLNTTEVRTKVISSPCFMSLYDSIGDSIIKIPELDIHDISIETTKQLILASGMRNTALNTCGPTGSIALISGNVSSGIEPIFSFAQMRVTRVGEKSTYFLLHTPVAKKILKDFTEDELNKGIPLSEIKRMYGIVEADELDFHTRLAMQECIQKHTDGAISSTVNLPETATPLDVKMIYLEGYKRRLKGCTIYRANSFGSILRAVTDNDATDSSKATYEGNAPASSTPAATNTNVDIHEMKDTEIGVRHRVTWNKSKVYLFVTLDEHTKTPLEIFIKLPRTVGEDSDGIYSERVFQEKFSLWEALTRMVSISLQHGVPVGTIIKQLNASKYTPTDPMAIIVRVLDEYDYESHARVDTMRMMDVPSIEDSPYSEICPKCKKKTFIHEGGCVICLNPDCNYTKCN